MSEFDFSEFDDLVDLEGLEKDIESAAQNNGNTGDFPDVPYGEYVVSIDKMELTMTKETKKPMLSVWFKILEGEHENSRIFMNQVVSQGFQIHIANEFLKSLDSDVDVKFSANGGYKAYNDMILDVYESISTADLEYALKYGENKKGYKTFEITDVYEPEE